jgi:7,8-dihydropterin-6-yl-methyl-4-(beta-D-ribofuranosyl)aminobenzene 5'-phosphate synthase
MHLTVLLDNNTFIDRYFLAEPGVSYFIETDGKRILFDTGYSDAFIRNAQKMGIDLLDVDIVVLSHGHLDHTWGLSPLIQLYTQAMIEKRAVKRPHLVAHPDVFASRRLGEIPEIGSMLPAEKLALFFDLQFSRTPIQLTEHLTFLGEIERVTDFEAQTPLGTLVENGVGRPDILRDDSALVYQAPDGLVIITGCSHSGICNIVAAAQAFTGEQRVVDIIGGFHLLQPSEQQLQGTIEFLSAVQPGCVHACHCTDLCSKITLAGSLLLKEVGVGLVLAY